MNMELVTANKKDVVERGLLSKSNLPAVITCNTSHMETFGEAPSLNKSEGAMPLHKQQQKIFFEKDNNIEVIFDHEYGQITLTNTISNELDFINFKTNSLDRISGCDVIKFEMDPDSAEKYPHLADKLSRLRIIDNDGVPLDGDTKRELLKVNPLAIWIEKAEMKDEDHVFINSVIANGNDRKSFFTEFEANTGPMMLNPESRKKYEHEGMSL
jgi:hypothetical protein